jgi:hypothetical protein
MRRPVFGIGEAGVGDDGVTPYRACPAAVVGALRRDVSVVVADAGLALLLS